MNPSQARTGSAPSPPVPQPGAGTGTGTGPLQRVLDALRSGVSSRDQLSGATGLPADVVDGALEHLVRSGRVVAESLGGGCPSDGCGGCPSGAGDTRAGCGAETPGHSRGPVALRVPDVTGPGGPRHPGRG